MDCDNFNNISILNVLKLFKNRFGFIKINMGMNKVSCYFLTNHSYYYYYYLKVMLFKDGKPAAVRQPIAF